MEEQASVAGAGATVVGQTQGKAKEKTKHCSPPPRRKCPSCKVTLKESWTKVLCRTCITDLVKQESAAARPQPEEMVSAFRKELADTFQSFRSLLDRGQGHRAVSPDRPRSSMELLRDSSESEEERLSVSSGLDDEEEEERIKNTPSRYKLTLEEVDDLLKAIHTTLDIREDRTQLSLHDKMFQGLEETKPRVFPVHKVLSDTVKREWKDPERAPFFSKSLKRRFPFEEDASQVWNKRPRLDAAFSQVSRNTDLAFEDMGVLKDPLEKRADALLKKAWDSTMSNLKPAMAATVVARNLEHWLGQLKEHIEAGTPRRDLLETIPILQKAVGYMADASAESIRMSARSSALLNSARRALWVKTWSGDTASKIRLCGLPFDGDLVFGPDLEQVLDRTADKKKAFPTKRKVSGQGRKNFRSFRQKETKDPPFRRSGKTPRGRGRTGVLFRPPSQTPKTP